MLAGFLSLVAGGFLHSKDYIMSPNDAQDLLSNAMPNGAIR
jgi:hypothetical protein